MREFIKVLLFDEDAPRVLACLPQDRSFDDYSDREKAFIAYYMAAYLTFRARDALKSEAVFHVLCTLANPLFVRRCIARLEREWERLGVRSVDDILLDVSPRVAALGKKLAMGKGYLPPHIGFASLDITDFSHPQDEWYLKKLRGTLGFDKLARFFMKHSLERVVRIQYTGSNLRVTPKLLPERYQLLEYACRQLKLPAMPEFYVEQGSINAMAVGDAEPIVVIHSGAFSLLSDEELLFLIGHELGHIKARHCLYHMMARVLPRLASRARNMTMGLSGVITIGLELALLQWRRMSEFTADRAGLLCCQNAEAACSVMMKWSGLPASDYGKADVAAFMDQARRFESFDNDSFDKIFKYASILGESHPWTVMRAKELLRWMEDGSYAGTLFKLKLR